MFIPKQNYIHVLVDEDAKLESDSYWHSEHHRFEYSQQLNELLRINPNSYHLLGVAVAGSFVNDG